LKRNDITTNIFILMKKEIKKPIEYLFPEAYVGDPGDAKSKSHDSISVYERENVIFIMNHRNSNFNTSDGRVYLSIFSLGKPKDGTDIYIDSDRKISKIQGKMF